MGRVIWRPSLARTPKFSLGRPAPSAIARCVPFPTSVWGDRLLELGRHFIGGFGRSSLLDVGLRGNSSVLADTICPTFPEIVIQFLF